MVGEPLLAPSAYGKIRGQEIKEREREGQGEVKGGMKMGRERRLSSSFIENPFLLVKIICSYEQSS